MRLQLAAGYPRGSRSILFLRLSPCSWRWHILSYIVAPGTSSTPPTITRPCSPHACASTAWISEERRMSATHRLFPSRQLENAVILFLWAAAPIAIARRDKDVAVGRDEHVAQPAVPVCQQHFLMRDPRAVLRQREPVQRRAAQR